MKEGVDDWLLAANGVYHGQPGGSWATLGDYRFTVNRILRTEGDRLVVGTGNGLWEVPADRTARWVQLNDETLTEVSALAETPVGIAAGSPYGVAVSDTDDCGVLRWRSLTEHLRVNARFTNTVVVDPADPTRWIVGTEGGVIVGTGSGADWEESDLNDGPVRSLIRCESGWLAASDHRGVQQSEDGRTWTTLHDGGDPVFDVALAGDRILAGTGAGLVVVVKDGGDAQRVGPRILARCVAVDPTDEDVWVVGADPGGIWVTADAGSTWKNSATVTRVRHIVPPGTGRES